jgi:hypothetical protein
MDESIDNQLCNWERVAASNEFCKSFFNIQRLQKRFDELQSNGRIDVFGFTMLMEHLGVFPDSGVIEKYFKRQCEDDEQIELPRAMVAITGIITSYLTLLRKEKMFKQTCDALAKPFSSLSSWDCYTVLKGINNGRDNSALIRYILENSKMCMIDYCEDKFKAAARNMLDLD